MGRLHHAHVAKKKAPKPGSSSTLARYVLFLLFGLSIFFWYHRRYQAPPTEHSFDEKSQCTQILRNHDPYRLVQTAAKILGICGFVRLGDLLVPAPIEVIRNSFPQIDTKTMQYGVLRSDRHQVVLPFEDPFRHVATDVFGPGSTSLALALAILGPDLTLDFVSIILASPNASKMDAHRDTDLTGTLTFAVPLQPLTADHAPVMFCIGTHQLKEEEIRMSLAKARIVGLTSVADSPGSSHETMQDLTDRTLCPEEKQVIGAPMAIGDVAVYDPRVFHWGMKSSQIAARLVMYITFKASRSHPGVQPLVMVEEEKALRSMRDFARAVSRSVELTLRGTMKRVDDL